MVLGEEKVGEREFGGGVFAARLAVGVEGGGGVQEVAW